MVQYNINTVERQIMFLSQLMHESRNFTALEENLNYSSDGLARVWPRRFKGVDGKPNKDALKLHRKPELIANTVYSGRLGNDSTGDGWKYRGRGLIQLTGKANYAAFARAIGNAQIMSTPDLLKTPEMACLSAAWFWNTNGLNVLADKGDLIGVTKKINGGTIGLESRKEEWIRVKNVLMS